MPTAASVSALRIGARVLLLDRDDRVLLIHARDPDQLDHHWWELPGGGCDPGETLEDTALREVAEETGIQLGRLGPRLWIRETHFQYRGNWHHRREHAYLARVVDGSPSQDPARTENEKLGLIEHRWWAASELTRCTDKLLPPNLPKLLAETIAGRLSAQPDLLFT